MALKEILILRSRAVGRLGRKGIIDHRDSIRVFEQNLKVSAHMFEMRCNHSQMLPGGRRNHVASAVLPFTANLLDSRIIKYTMNDVPSPVGCDLFRPSGEIDPLDGEGGRTYPEDLNGTPSVLRFEFLFAVEN